MVKTKRIISLIVAMVASMGVCFLTACGTSDNANNSANRDVTHSFAISKTTMSLEVGQSEKLECSYGDKKIVFSSSDDKIATVSQDGTVSAVSAGEAYITAKAEGVEDAEKMCKVTVVKNDYAVKLDREEVITAVITDESITLDFVAAVLKNGEKSDISAKFTVSPTGAEMVVSGNSARITFSAVGEYTVKAEYKNSAATVTVKVINKIA